MMSAGVRTASPLGDKAPPGLGVALAGGSGLLCYIAASLVMLPLQWNVVTYTVTSHPDVPHRPLGVAFLLSLTAAPPLFALVTAYRTQAGPFLMVFFSKLWPLLLSAPLIVCTWSEVGFQFLATLLHILGAGWSVRLALDTKSGCDVVVGDLESSTRRGGFIRVLAPGSLVLLIVTMTVIHTRIQINFFEHFMLGHADMGHFAEELKNVLAGRGLRSDSFPNTRLGWHFTPLLYLLAPFYWLWPSPVFLMACSALFVHGAAVPIYWLARRLSGSPLTAWLLSLAWLLHPSISRLPYSGTYGFQWLYVTLPLVVWWMGAGLCDRRRLFYVLLVLLLLCRETTAATTLGFGLILAIFLGRPREGLATALISALYGIACVTWIIPHFARSETYERSEMFGSLGSGFLALLFSAFTDAGVFWGRLVRGEAILFLAILVVTLALRPLRSWRISLAAIPALFLILLMENAQWLSIKYWYQVSFLPILFVAAMTRPISARSEEEIAPGASRRLRIASVGCTAAVLLCCGWGHYLFGFSPLAKYYDLYTADERLQSVDPTFRAVSKWRRQIPRTATILATERLAAHFTDYRRIYTGKRPKPADYVVIDAADGWDTTGLANQSAAYRADPAYRVYDTQDSVVVFERLIALRVTPDD